MQPSQRMLRPHHKVGIVAALLGLIVVLGLAVSAVVSPTSGPPAAAVPTTPSTTVVRPDAPTGPGRPQLGSRPGPRGVRPMPRESVAPVPGGVRLVSASMQFDGRTRTWLLATPKTGTAGQRLPLLIDLHGRGSDPRFAAQQSGLLSWVAGGHAAAVFPAGYAQSWDADGCCGVAAADHINDLGFLRALALRLAARPDIDATQLAVLGFSNGGRMALDLACSRYLATGGLTLRAVVAIESINSSRCIRGPGIPTLVTAGTDDPFVGYDQPTFDPEGGQLPSAQEEVAAWSASEACPEPSTVAGVFPAQIYACTQGAIHLVTIPGGRHRWPPAIDPTIDAFLQAAITVPST